MSPGAEIALVVQRELRKSVRSIKGIILGILSVLGAAVGVLVCIFLENEMKEDLGAKSTEEFGDLQEAALTKVYGDPAVGAYLGHAPWSLILFFTLTVWLGAGLVWLMGFDSMSSDMQFRAVRFWTVRTRRSSFYIGKFLGLWATVALVILAISVLSWLVVLIRGSTTFGATVSWGGRLWLFSVPIVGAWCAVAMFISGLFKRPLVALLTNGATFFTMWLVYIIGIVSKTKWLTYVYPNAYEDLLLSPHPSKVLGGLGGCLVFMILGVGGGVLIFDKRDV